MINILINNVPAMPPLTGIGHYANRLIHGLANHPEVDQVIYFDGKRFSINKRVTGQPKGLTIAKAIGRRIPYARILRDLMVNRRFSRQCAEFIYNYNNLIYVEPGYVLKPFEGPAVPIIYDLSNIICPEHHPDDRVAYLNRKIPETLKRATRVITISEFIKQQIVDHYGVGKNLIDVVYPVVDETYFPRTGEKIHQVLKRYNLTPGYYLSVGTIEPRKNLAGLIGAFKCLPECIRSEHPLVIVGAKGWKCKVDSKYKTPGDIRLLGYVNQEDLPFLYSGALALAYPSFYEGFGMPIAEAMACGTPVITSNCSAMPEASGNGALLVDPYNVEQIADALERVSTSDDLRKTLAEKSINVSRKYSLLSAVSAMMETLYSSLGIEAQ